jgi:hypothetical protein
VSSADEDGTVGTWAGIAFAGTVGMDDDSFHAR